MWKLSHLEFTKNPESVKCVKLYKTQIYKKKQFTKKPESVKCVNYAARNYKKPRELNEKLSQPKFTRNCHNFTLLIVHHRLIKQNVKLTSTIFNHDLINIQHRDLKNRVLMVYQSRGASSMSECHKACGASSMSVINHAVY